MRLISLSFFIMALMSMISCKKETGAFKTKSGYDYNVITKGKGQVAKPEDYVFFSLIVRGDNGKVLQENNNPDQLPAMQVPLKLEDVQPANPVLEIFTTAAIGDSIVFIMPIDSLKGGAAGLEGMKHIEYVIAVKDIKDKEDYDEFVAKMQEKKRAEGEVVKAKLPAVEAQAKQTLADYLAGKVQTQETPSGLKYVIHEEGTGIQGEAGKIASVQYYGMLKNGEMFDNSFSRGSAFQFVIGKGSVIKGWDEALQLLKAGSKATLFIPSSLGYGETGNAGIPGNSDLIFYIEVEDIK